MFKQAKSAFFWYYLYKFRRRVILVVLLLIIAIFANAIYGDVVEYLKLKKRLEFLELALALKWIIIIFNIVFSIYLLLTIFKKQEDQNQKNQKEEKNRVKTPNKEEKKKDNKEEKFTAREKEFLNKKKIRSAADILVDK